MESFLDGFSVAILFFLWFEAVLNFHKLPQVIPIHFDFHGNPDNEGSKYFIFLLPFLATLIYIFLSYNISSIDHFPVKITPENTAVQTKIVTLAVKSIIAYTVMMFTYINRFIIKTALKKESSFFRIFYLIAGLFIIISAFLVAAYIYR